MPSIATVRRWRARLAWPNLLAAVWLTLYTSAIVFDSTYAYSERSAVAYLFSAAHLSRPVGWLFVASILVVLNALLLRVYLAWAD